MGFLRYLLAFLIGAAAGFIPGILVSLLIQALWPYEHMLYGLAGIVIAAFTVPLFGILAAARFGPRRPRDARGPRRPPPPADRGGGGGTLAA